MEFKLQLVVLPVLACLITFVLMPIVRRLSIKCGAVAVPGGRRLHKAIVPLSGGVAIFFGFLIAVLFIPNLSHEVLGMMIGASIIACVGFIDDMYELPPIAKFLGQTIAALIVISAGVTIELIGNLGSGNDGVYYLGFLSLPLTFFWIIGITNAINFIDGLDGLAGGVSAIAAATLGVVSLMSGNHAVALLCFILAASAFAFLPSNFTNHPKRKIFMGDSGSGFLGFSLAVLAIMSATKTAALFSMLVPIIILAVPIFDTGFAIVRRVLSGKSPFEADRHHLHHRILNKGFSNRQTTLVIYAITLVLSILAVVSTNVADKYIPYLFISAAIIFAVFLWRMGVLRKIEEKIK